MRSKSIMQKQVVTLSNNSLFNVLVNESAELTLVTDFIFIGELLTRTCFVLVGVIKPLEIVMGEGARICTR